MDHPFYFLSRENISDFFLTCGSETNFEYPNFNGSAYAVNRFMLGAPNMLRYETIVRPISEDDTINVMIRMKFSDYAHREITDEEWDAAQASVILWSTPPTRWEMVKDFIFRNGPKVSKPAFFIGGFIFSAWFSFKHQTLAIALLIPLGVWVMGYQAFSMIKRFRSRNK